MVGGQLPCKELVCAVVLVSLLFVTIGVKAQHDSLQRVYETLGIAAEELTEEDFERIDYWAEYAAHPLDLNTVTLQQLQSLPFLEEGEAEAIGQYKECNQCFTSVYDLAWVEGFTKDRARFLAMFFLRRDASSITAWGIVAVAGLSQRRIH